MGFSADKCVKLHCYDRSAAPVCSQVWNGRYFSEICLLQRVRFNFKDLMRRVYRVWIHRKGIYLI